MAVPRWTPPFEASFEEVQARLAKAGTHHVRCDTCAGEFDWYDRDLDAAICALLNEGDWEPIERHDDESIQLRSNNWYTGGPRPPATLHFACLGALLLGTRYESRGRILALPGRVARSVRAAAALGPEELACACHVLVWCSDAESDDNYGIPRSMYAFGVLSALILLMAHGKRRVRRVLPSLEIDAELMESQARQVEGLIPQDARYWLNRGSAHLVELDDEQREDHEWHELASLVLKKFEGETPITRRLAQAVAAPADA